MMKNKFIWPADSQGVKRLKRKEEFGLILNLRFLLGWRLRHQAKTMTACPASAGSLLIIPSVLARGIV
jgi:hypothetical protein